MDMSVAGANPYTSEHVVGGKAGLFVHLGQVLSAGQCLSGYSNVSYG